MRFRSDRQRRAVMAQLQNRAVPKAYSLAQLQYLNARRRPASLRLDLKLHNANTINPNDASVAAWIRSPGRFDVQDVDTPGSDLPIEHRAGGATFKLDPLAGDLFTLKLPPGKRHVLSPELRKRRDANVAALQGLQESLAKDVSHLRKELETAQDAAKGRVARKKLREAQHASRNASKQLDAYRTGSFILMGAKSNRKLIREYAKLLRESFDWNPNALGVAALYVGTTREPGVGGYTHRIKHGAYEAPFIAINNATYDLTKPLASSLGRKRRLTMIHEAVHVAREHQDGRTVPETKSVKHYGAGRAEEEKHTVLETQLRAGSRANVRGESYYAFIPEAPQKVGATDNRLTLDAPRPRIVRDMRVLNRFMHRNAKRTYIDRLDFRGGRWRGRNPGNVDRVVRTSDGDEIQIHNPAGTTRDVASFVDSLDGDAGDRIQEYRGGNLRRIGRR